MTRERAIELIGAMKGDLCDFYDYDDLTALDMAISALSDYEKMQEISLDLAFENDELINKSRWIPVSEMLPLLRGLYKISDDVLITNGFEIDMGYLAERKGKICWHYYGSEVEIDIKDEDNDATAWMPLPEPYRKEVSE